MEIGGYRKWTCNCLCLKGMEGLRWETKTWWKKDCDFFFRHGVFAPINKPPWETKTWWKKDCDFHSPQTVLNHAKWETKTWWKKDCDLCSSKANCIAFSYAVGNEDLMKKGLRRRYKRAGARPAPTIKKDCDGDRMIERWRDTEIWETMNMKEKDTVLHAIKEITMDQLIPAERK